MQPASASTLALAAAIVPFALVAALPSRASSRAPDYASEVAPIFRARCSPCHTKGAAAGGLSLESYAALMKGGASGPAVAASRSDASNLVKRLRGEGGLPRMPMGFKPLSGGDMGLILAWIDAGAKPSDPGTSKPHWAFVPPVAAKVPPGILHPVDAFVLRRLKEAGLSFSLPADRRTLLRRVTLDLTGLPPTPAEIDAFLVDREPAAYERVVDRLLASPHYGERMALPWLDAARYADSNGFQQDGDTFQFVWRDWVVRALNANMPFDQFTIEQLAGDLLPNPTLDQKVATAFNRNHMLNGEGGAIPEEQRFVNLFDRVDTTSLTWMGLTMGCARCHDHKYDPVPQRDYYAMLAYFNKVPETGVPSGSGQYRVAEPWIYAGKPEQMAAMAQAQKSIRAAKDALEGYRAGADFESEFRAWKSDLARHLQDPPLTLAPWSEAGDFVAETFDGAFSTAFGPERAVFSKLKPRPDLADGNVHPLSGDNRAFYFVRTLEAARAAPYLLSLGSDDGIKVFWNGEEVFSRKVTRAAAPDSDRVVVSLRPGTNTLVLKIVNGGGVGGFYFKGHWGGVDPTVAALAASDVPGDAQKLRAAYADSGVDLNTSRLRKAQTDAEAELAKIQAGIPRVMVMSDAQPRTTHVLRRGNYEEPLEAVEADTPTAFSKVPGPPTRLTLAKWIVSPRNPLTARVQVNRAWLHFFGRGLVRTEENFGLQGEPPSHPELLDWLAVNFRKSGWNMKRLHRLIVTSRTYRQSSALTPKLSQADGDNSLYGRAPRLRLPSMVLRDVALASSGLLDRTVGGKPVYPYQPTGIWDGLAITKERDFTYPQSTGKDLHRRSLYTFWRRTASPGNMFDSSSRQVCTVKPTVTSSPMHALTMLNDVTWIECAAALADAVSGAGTLEDRLGAAFLRVCGRRPTAAEGVTIKRSYTTSLKAFRAYPEATRAFLTLGEFRPRQISPDVAALAAVCLSIYNLDEAITRE